MGALSEKRQKLKTDVFSFKLSLLNLNILAELNLHVLSDIRWYVRTIFVMLRYRKLDFFSSSNRWDRQSLPLSECFIPYRCLPIVHQGEKCSCRSLDWHDFIEAVSRVTYGCQPNFGIQTRIALLDALLRLTVFLFFIMLA